MQENESAWVYALAFAKRDEQAAAALLSIAKAPAASGPRRRAWNTKTRPAACGGGSWPRLVELDATRAAHWRRRARAG